MKRSIYGFCLIFFIMISCQFPQPNLFKEINRENDYGLKMDNSYFEGLGCFESIDCLPEEIKNLEHPVSYIIKPANNLGGLTPVIPLAVAKTISRDPEDMIQSVYVERCSAKSYARYLVLFEGKIHLIDSIEGLAAQFAPIESQEEALSYAIAATGFSAIKDLRKSPKPKFYSDKIDETYVRAKGEGYIVHLFDDYLCGCGPHIAQSVDITVQKDGTIQLSAPVDAFSDPQYDGLCID
jgi:hypothetical protein